MRFANSASRHGISQRSIAHVVEVYGVAAEVELASSPDDLGLLYVGDDYRGMPLEIIGLPVQTSDDTTDLLIIHAMPLRTLYASEYARVMRERWG